MHACAWHSQLSVGPYLCATSLPVPALRCPRPQSIGLENTEDNRRTYRELLVTTPGLGKYISGAIMFEETLFQKVRSLASRLWLSASGHTSACTAAGLLNARCG